MSSDNINTNASTNQQSPMFGLDSHTYHLLVKLIQLALEEDVQQGDITTVSTISSSSQSIGRFLAKEDGVISGLAVAKVIFHHIDPTIQVDFTKEDGSGVKQGDYFGTAKGKTRQLLIAERLVLNIMQRMSGISTHTYLMNKEMNSNHTKLLDTRKTVPGLRMLDKLAVKYGGGENHRIGLFDMILIKDNHITSAGGVVPAIELAVSYTNQHHPTDLQGKPVLIEVETRTIDEVKQVLDCQFKVDRMLLDNMVKVTVDENGNRSIDTSMLKQAHEMIKNSSKSYILTEASGNVTIHSVKKIAETGVDFISSGSLTHSVTALDISMKIQEIKKE